MSVLDLLRRGRADVDVAVVGTGLPALAVALELAGRRRRVSLAGYAGAEESPRGLGLALLGTSDPYDRACLALGHEQARTLWAAGRENLEHLRSFLEQGRRDCGLESRGSFVLAADREEAEWLAESEDRLREDGFSGEFLDHYMLETRFDVSGFTAAYWAAEGAEVDLARLVHAAAEAGRAAGVHFVPVPVRALEDGRSGVTVETEAGPVRATAAVVATDAAASDLLPELGSVLRPAEAGRLRVVPEPGATLPTAARTVDGRVAWRLSASGLTLAATGAASAVGPEEEPWTRLEPVAARLHARPGSGRGWAEPGETAPDGWPVVGGLPGRPLAVACGFGPLAASFAFVAARWVADALVTGRDPTPLPLRPRPASGRGAV